MQAGSSRREFIKASVAAATAAAVGLCVPETRAHADPEEGWRWDNWSGGRHSKRRRFPSSY